MGIPDEFLAEYERHLKEAQKGGHDFPVIDRQFRYDAQPQHPSTYMDQECTFAARQIATLGAHRILDVGSYRLFVLGLLAADRRVWTVDVRAREPAFFNEIVLTCDAKSLDLPSNFFDLVVSLSVLEHLGLGRYGDEVNLYADRKALAQMVRVLRPGGALIFTTTLTKGLACLAFNAHRIYSYDMLCKMCRNVGLALHEEAFVKRAGRFCSFEEVSTKSKDWDIYCGCWTKAA